MIWLIAEGEMPSAEAAAVKLRRSATSLRASRPSS
jgi:hypothetical protein